MIAILLLIADQGYKYYKLKNHVKFLNEKMDDQFTVFRGDSGNSVQVPVKDLVVGDIVQLKKGDFVPADCLLIQGENVTVEQAISQSNETAFKEVYDSNMEQYPDPFLYSRSLMLSGQGKAVVCATGNSTYAAKMFKLKGIILGVSGKTF